MTDAYLYEPGTQKGETAAELIRLTRENVDLRVQLGNERNRCVAILERHLRYAGSLQMREMLRALLAEVGEK